MLPLHYKNDPKQILSSIFSVRQFLKYSIQLTFLRSNKRVGIRRNDFRGIC